MKELQKETKFCTKFLCIISLAIFGSLWQNGECSRQLALHVNPGCDIPDCKSEANRTSYVNLVHIKASGEKDVLHYLWSTIGAPSMLLVRTTLSSELVVNWTSLVTKDNSSDEAISFSEGAEYYYSMTVANLWEFRDTGDNGKLSPSNETTSISFDDLSWDDVMNSVSNGTSHCSIKFVTMKNESDFIKADGSLSLEIDVYGDDGRNEALPRLQHTQNSTQLKIVLDGMNRKFKESRYGMELLIMSSGKNEDELKIDTEESIDDEYTPGVFKTVYLTSNFGGFLYWKPVVYTSPDHVITNSTDVMSYDIKSLDLDSMPYSIARAYSDFRTDNATVFGTNITFGSQKDGFYEKTYYQTWTAMIGAGTIPEDKISLLVIIVIAAGLGLPLLVMALGGVYLLVDKFRKQKDDLLLSQDGR